MLESGWNSDWPADGPPIVWKASVLGRSIQWDGAKEQIVDDAKATELLSQTYRAPWQYPAA
jgi:hypothetical protein